MDSTMNATRHLAVTALLTASLALSGAFAQTPKPKEASGSQGAPGGPGTPGSPGATTTIDGRYLPNPPPPFGGEINLDAKQSKPWWPPNVVPPKGAPNVLLIMTDDAGYGVSGTFGGVIPTPTMDRIAKMGLRYTQFHSTAL